jgi:hypothetical protein
MLSSSRSAPRNVTARWRNPSASSSQGQPNPKYTFADAIQVHHAYISRARAYFPGPKPSAPPGPSRTTSPGLLAYQPNTSPGHEALSLLVLLSTTLVLMGTVTASSIGSLKGTSIRSRPCSYFASAL